VNRITALGGDAFAVPTNLGAQDEVITMVRTAASHFGSLEILVNNAAITFVGDLTIPLHRHDLIMEVDLRAPIIATREAVPHMIAAGGGAIVNVSSLAALLPSRIDIVRDRQDWIGALHRGYCTRAPKAFHRRQLFSDRHPGGIGGILWRTLLASIARNGSRARLLPRGLSGCSVSRRVTPGGGRVCTSYGRGRELW